VSGLVTDTDHEKWPLEDIRPVWDVLLSAFWTEPRAIVADTANDFYRLGPG
jgi:hypothetical protein